MCKVGSSCSGGDKRVQAVLKQNDLKNKEKKKQCSQAEFTILQHVSQLKMATSTV